MSKDNKREMVLNFETPNKDQLTRNGEEPEYSVVAVHPEHTDVVSIALEQLMETLQLHMPLEHIYLMEEEAIQMHGGQVLELGPYSLFFSLTYPTEAGRTYEMQFGAPPNTVLH